MVNDKSINGYSSINGEENVESSSYAKSSNNWADYFSKDKFSELYDEAVKRK